MAYESELDRFLKTDLHQSVARDIATDALRGRYLKAMERLFDRAEGTGKQVKDVVIQTAPDFSGSQGFQNAYCLLDSVVVYVGAMPSETINRSEVNSVDIGADYTAITWAGHKKLQIFNVGRFFGRDFGRLCQLLKRELSKV